MTKDITLIVLAAGAGKRFWPLTTSKALFPFFGLPMFAHTIGDVPKEISRMIIVTNPHNDTIIRSFEFPIPTSTVVQKEPKGMADAVLSCREAISGPILIVNVDDIIDPELLTNILKTDLFGAVSGMKQKGPFGFIAFDGERPVGIAEKPKDGGAPSEYAKVVCDYISDGQMFVSELARTKSASDDVYEKALTALMRKNQFEFIPYAGPLAVLKYPWHVLDAMKILFEDLESHKGKNVVIKSNVVIEGPVFIEDNVKIFENTKIVGPVYIGANSIIGNNAIIRESHIGADSVIGFNCDVTRSYIGDNCWLHSNYIGDSVLEGNISMGGGACLANLRLDDGKISSEISGKKVVTGRTKLGVMIGKGVRIGVNASIMPGVKIGKNAFVGSGVVLDRDLPEDSFCMAKVDYTVTKNLKTAADSRAAFKKKI